MNFDYTGIVIFGGMGSGKNTYTDFIVDTLKKNNINSRSYNIGDLCREIMQVGLINEDWHYNNRKLAQLAATKLREIDENILNQYTLSRLFTDLKELNPEITLPISTNNIKDTLLRYNASILPIIIGGRTLEDFHYWNSLGFLTVGVTSNKSDLLLSTRDLGQKQADEEKKHPTEANAEYIARKLCKITIENNDTLDSFKSKSEESLLLLSSKIKLS